VTPSASSSRIASQLGLAERIFAGPRARRLIDGVEAGLDRVDANLERELHISDALADATSRYLFDAGGKRVRPMLALLTAHLGDGVTEDVVEAATALELTHLGSLYHDDVMDDADKRRGVPSAHSVWGNNIAILTGDLLFARASQIMARLGEGAIRLQANTFERLVLGQMHETVGPTDADDRVAFYLQVLADKTGSLIAAAASSATLPPSTKSRYAPSVRQPASPSSCWMTSSISRQIPMRPARCRGRTSALASRRCPICFSRAVTTPRLALFATGSTRASPGSLTARTPRCWTSLLRCFGLTARDCGTRQRLVA